MVQFECILGVIDVVDGLREVGRASLACEQSKWIDGYSLMVV